MAHVKEEGGRYFLFNVSLVETFGSAVEKGTAVTQGLWQAHAHACTHTHVCTASEHFCGLKVRAPGKDGHINTQRQHELIQVIFVTPKNLIKTKTKLKKNSSTAKQM